MRQMRLKKREIRDAEKLRQILADCDVVHIGAMDGDGMFVVPSTMDTSFVRNRKEKKPFPLSRDFRKSASVYSQCRGGTEGRGFCRGARGGF